MFSICIGAEEANIIMILLLLKLPCKCQSLETAISHMRWLFQSLFAPVKQTGLSPKSTQLDLLGEFKIMGNFNARSNAQGASNAA